MTEETLLAARYIAVFLLLNHETEHRCWCWLNIECSDNGEQRYSVPLLNNRNTVIYRTANIQSSVNINNCVQFQCYRTVHCAISCWWHPIFNQHQQRCPLPLLNNVFLLFNSKTGHRCWNWLKIECYQHDISVFLLFNSGTEHRCQSTSTTMSASTAKQQSQCDISSC
jgi:hypothetical protein